MPDNGFASFRARFRIRSHPRQLLNVSRPSLPEVRKLPRLDRSSVVSAVSVVFSRLVSVHREPDELWFLRSHTAGSSRHAVHFVVEIQLEIQCFARYLTDVI